MNEPDYGRTLRSDFQLDESLIHLNQGSYGTYPKAIVSVLHDYQRKAELNPDKWLRREVYPVINENRRTIATLLNADPMNLVFVNNATTGINSVLRSFPFQKGQTIIHFSTVYNSVEKTLLYLKDTIGVELVSVELRYPLSDDEVIQAVQKTVSFHSGIRLCVLDAISSSPGVRFPYERVIHEVLKPNNILSLVDGAHAPGHIPVDLAKTDPDFFVGNLHKWLYVPRGIAILYVAKRHQHHIHPTVINSAYESPSDIGGKDDTMSNFQREFVWPGTQDFSNVMCIKAALDYRKFIGGEEGISAYCHDLAVRGGALAADILGTEVMENSDQTLTAFLVNVRLPPFSNSKSIPELIEDFYDKMLYEHNCSGLVYYHNDSWYIRLSAQVYNDVDDFRHIANALRTICNEFNNK